MRRSREIGTAIVNGAVALSMLTIAAVLVYRTFFAIAPVISASVQAPELLDDWQSIHAVGHRMGPSKASVTIVTFSDFECPACAHLANEILPSIRAKYPQQVAVVYRHWPLSRHRFALPAARASECAANQNRFEAFHDALFAKQDSLGLKSFGEFARDAGVTDLDRFNQCVGDPATPASITQDLDEARRLGGTGTPTVIVNGWILRGGALSRLDSVVAATMRESKR